MRENRTPGSVRGAPSNGRLYRDDKRKMKPEKKNLIDGTLFILIGLCIAWYWLFSSSWVIAGCIENNQFISYTIGGSVQEYPGIPAIVQFLTLLGISLFLLTWGIITLKNNKTWLRVIISAYVGYIIGSVSASLPSIGDVFSSIIWGPAMIFSSFSKDTGGLFSISLFLLSLSLLIALCIIGKKRNQPMLIYLSSAFFVATVFFLGGRTAILTL